MKSIQWASCQKHNDLFCWFIFRHELSPYSLKFCFGPASSKCEEQKLCGEPSLIQDKQGFDSKYDSGISLASKEPRLPRLQAFSPAQPAPGRIEGPSGQPQPHRGVVYKHPQLDHHLRCPGEAWSWRSCSPELEHTEQV